MNTIAIRHLDPLARGTVYSKSGAYAPSPLGDPDAPLMAEALAEGSNFD